MVACHQHPFIRLLHEERGGVYQVCDTLIFFIDSELPAWGMLGSTTHRAQGRATGHRLAVELCTDGAVNCPASLYGRNSY